MGATPPTSGNTVHSLDVPQLAGLASTTHRPHLGTRALVATLLLLAGVLPGTGADDCTAKCAALMTEFRTTIPAERVTAVEQSPAWLRSLLQMFCQRKSLYAGAAARAEFGFCQHAASRAVALLEREGGLSLSAACSNSTRMAFGENSELCAVATAGVQQEIIAPSRWSDQPPASQVDPVKAAAPSRQATQEKAAGSGSEGGQQLVQCVQSVVARTRHGNEPTPNDRLFYSHRRHFGRGWAADFLLSHKHRIKYYQMPKCGSKAIRGKMSLQFGIPYKFGNTYGRNLGVISGGTPMENRVKPIEMDGEVADYFTFTFVAEPLTRLVNGILQTQALLTGDGLVSILREMVLRDREPTGSWTSSAKAYNVHWASQVALLMDLFDAAAPPRLDYVGHVEELELGWNQTLQGYLRYNIEQGARVDDVLFKDIPERASFVKPPSRKADLWQALNHEPQLLCDVARMLEFDYECLPEYDASRWCPPCN